MTTDLSHNIKKWAIIEDGASRRLVILFQGVSLRWPISATTKINSVQLILRYEEDRDEA